MNKEISAGLSSEISGGRKFSMVVHGRDTRRYTHLSFLQPLEGEEENSGFPIAPMNVFRRGVKGQETTWVLQARGGEAAPGERVEVWVTGRA